MDESMGGSEATGGTSGTSIGSNGAAVFSGILVTTGGKTCLAGSFCSLCFFFARRQPLFIRFANCCLSSTL